MLLYGRLFFILHLGNLLGLFAATKLEGQSWFGEQRAPSTLGGVQVITTQAQQTKPWQQVEQREKEENDNREEDRQGVDREIIEAVENRLERIKSVCRRYTKKKTELFKIRRNFLLNPGMKIGFCWNQKAGSTSLSEVFVRLANLTHVMTQDQLYRLPDFISPKTQHNFERMIVEDQLFILVRHPFNRIVSAYRDKILEHPTSFAGQQVIQQIGLNSSQSQPPSFPDFVRFLVKTNVEDYDPHWFPYYLQCAPCQVDYSRVLKVETIDEDWSWIQHNTVISQPFPHRNSVGKGAEEVRSYLSTLEQGLYRQLYAKYKKDFMLFGYDPIV